MTNLDRYRDDILNLLENFALNRNTGKVIECLDMDCCDCLFDNDSEQSCMNRRLQWLCEEFKEPPVNWCNVPIDTKVLGSDDGEHWYRRHFAGVDDEGKPTTWYDGLTSWSVADKRRRNRAFKYVKLADDNNRSRLRMLDVVMNCKNLYEETCKDIRETHIDDSVCGMCIEDCDSGLAECSGYYKDDCFRLNVNKFNDIVFKKDKNND